MSRRCMITGRGVMTGNNVSHAHNKTRRTFLPNLQTIKFRSDILNHSVKLKVSIKGLRTIEHNGGLDKYLLSKSNSRLTADALKIKNRIKKVQAANA